MFASSCGGWIHRAAAEVLKLGHQPHLYSPFKNSTHLPESNFHRCWVYNAACQPFFRLAQGRFGERAAYALLPVWRTWMRRQRPPKCDVVHSVMGSAAEPFRIAEQIGALKVLDASNSHPTSFYGFWQRELDIWNPAARISVTRRIFAQINQEIHQADVIMCASDFVRDSMRYNGIPESKLAVNPFGVDLQQFVPREHLPKHPRFLFVGGLTLRKGLQYLIPAFERLKQQYPTAELILCGSLYHADFESLYHRWKHLFTHIPGLPHAELAKLMRNCTAFVFPSIEEGFARVIAEAMGSGLPIIATHNSGATTMVENGKHGIIVPAWSPDPVFEAMREMIEKPALCENMGRAATARMATEGSWSAYAGRLSQTYGKHLADRR